MGILSALQHDEGLNCGNLGSNGGEGRYLMFPHATDEVRENNDKFSPCSVEHISKILNLKKDDCFVGEKSRFRWSRVEAKCFAVNVNNYTL